MKITLIILAIISLISCSKNDSLALIMEASFDEQFINACNENQQCINAVDSYMGVCFSKELAIDAINANKEHKRKINTQHILTVQECISKQSGKNYWKEINMPNHILSQVN